MDTEFTTLLVQPVADLDMPPCYPANPPLFPGKPASNLVGVDSVKLSSCERESAYDRIDTTSSRVRGHECESYEPHDGSNSGSEKDPDVLLLKNLHLLARHSQDVLYFPLLCVGTRRQICSIMVSALMHRRIFGVSSPLLGLSFDPLECEIQVVYGWLAASPSHGCIEAHLAYSPCFRRLDHGCGAFDLSVYSSLRCFTTYLLEVTPVLLASSYNARGNSPQVLGQLRSLAWQVDSLLDEEREEREYHFQKWISEQW
ncbi:hypothetical protein E1B28_010941 [Marasmius oreades]|uniref:Uncharacterized protein n=1 Tax=Marasmius oreades TaxID=181124 RepID=A0A9P7RTL2_9AGAR|nr:uncharacterized protein E1B28_010941 [Marasmius oreades]KAG7089242.1 hypothetical protein E1B28_010941 [Marasmius oreades]